jgi:UDP-GlcNAc:undecaprenyl-phosphate GlcNAc-1-phosphate transferase
MSGSLTTILISFLLSFLCVGLVLRVSHRNSWYDQVDDRKIHTGDVPRLGGIGFASAYILIALFITLFYPEFSPGIHFMAPIAALIIILVSGVIDDFHPLSPWIKLLTQGVCALCIILPGYTFLRPFFFGPGWLSSLGASRYFFTFIWIVGLANAMNFIDGVDGLAGGVSVLIALSYAGIFFLMTDTGPGILFCLSLAAVIAGFMIFNLPLPRARIFMGDGGSQFLGFSLASLPLITQNNSKDLPMFYAGALVLIPVYDTIAAIWRRIRDRRRIDSPDKSHIHHKLMNLGLNSKQVDLALYGVQIVLSVLVLLAVKFNGVLSLVFLGMAYLSCLGFFAAVHFMNRGRNRRLNKIAEAEVNQ